MEPAMSDEEFSQPNVFKVAVIIAILVLASALVGLFSNLG